MIYTLTLNPSVDYNIEIDDFQEGGLNIIKSEYKTPGGKGINVSQVLKNHGHDSIALGYLGGFTGGYIKEKLKEKEILTDFIQIEHDTRINVKIKGKTSETEINSNSLIVGEEKIDKLFEKIKHIRKSDILVLSGSVPHSMSKDIYKKIMSHLNKEVYVIVDAKGEALQEALKEKPFLIKPNHHELEELFNKKLNGIEEIIEHGEKLREQGAKNVIISMAGDGAIFITDNETYRSNVPKGTVRNSVGAGDSVVGGFIAAMEDGKELLDCFKYGVASGSASAFSSQLCTKEEVEELIKEIKIEKI